MSRYFIDTEFIEGFHKPIFGKRRHFIDLISIGIVAEDGRTYYAISNEFNPDDADKWVMDNVIVKLFFHNELRQSQSFEAMLKILGKPNKQIANEIIDFVSRDESDNELGRMVDIQKEPPEFYGYYSDYDWVLFCSLFGRMIDLPKGFPMYCIDLKQMMDGKIKEWSPQGDIHNPDLIKCFILRYEFPKQENEHNALDDANWNYELYKFLKKI